MITLTGKTADEVVQLMKTRLEPSAYSEVPHATYLTEIDPSYLREALTEAFGLIGYGWMLDVEDHNIDIVEKEGAKIDNRTGEVKKKWTEYDVTLIRADLKFRYREGEPDLPIGRAEIFLSYPIITTGSSTNRSKGDAIEGAITNAIGKAAKKLLWQLDVYKGKLSHKNAGGSGKKSGEKSSKKGSKSTAKKINGNGGSLTPSALLEIRSLAIMDPSEITPTEFWTVSNGLKVSKEDADAIVKEVSGFADALVAVIDNFGGPEVADLLKSTGG
jgi:hypothetical protein